MARNLTLIGSTKCDGSSVSLIFKNDTISVGSRNLIKPMKITKTTGVRNPNFLERVLIFFGRKIDLWVKEVVDNDDQFIELDKPYIEKIKTYLGDNPKYKNFPKSMEEVLTRAKMRQKCVVLSPHWFFHFDFISLSLSLRVHI